MSSLGVVVPAFRPDVERLGTYLQDIADTLDPVVIRVELDDPDEATTAAVSDIGVSPVVVNTVDARRGKGAAITDGFEALGTDRLAFADADGSTGAAELATVVAALEDADVAVGSRRHPESAVAGHQTLARRLLGDGFAWLARRLLAVGLYDYQCGAKALSAEAWSAVRDHIHEPGFAWDIELLAVAAAMELRIREVPIRWEDKPGSTVAPVRTTLSMLRALFVARHRAKRLQNSGVHRLLGVGEDPPALIDREER